MEIKSIILSDVHSVQGKCVATVAVAFSEKMKSREVVLVLNQSGKNNARDIRACIKDTDAELNEKKGKFLHFKLDSLEHNTQYEYNLEYRHYAKNGEGYKRLSSFVVDKSKGQSDKHKLKSIIFKTPPKPGVDMAFKGAFGADQEQITLVGDNLAIHDKRKITTRIYQQILEEGVDIFLHGSDVFHGETVGLKQTAGHIIDRLGNLIDRDKPIREFLKPVTKLDDFRDHLHKDFAKPARDKLAGIPSYATKDDHDLGVNDASDYQDNKVAFDNALGAFAELWPHPTSEESTNSELHGLYFKVTHGAADIWCLHTRLFADSASHKNKLLGDKQYDWLKQGLENSQAKIKLIVTPLPFMTGKNAAEDHRKDADNWHDLLQLFARTGVKAIFAGDSHYYSRVDLQVTCDENGAKPVTIPQFIVGTLGGYPQVIRDEDERSSIPKVALPKGLSDDKKISYEGSRVQAYYTPKGEEAFLKGENQSQDKHQYGFLSFSFSKVSDAKGVPKRCLHTEFKVTSDDNDSFVAMDTADYYYDTDSECGDDTENNRVEPSLS